MIFQNGTALLSPAYLAYAGQEHVVWNRTGHVCPVFANYRKDRAARRDETVMG
ncbi:hypothetical protein [Luteolibacter luteus]|uniref:Uncharacterized protein n=1 Tax=Luteolibacter luteus TaxID=2728835 RepID=A0A858RNB8_9BACT|nr:hypothetical protein [Luteolibacter luteus]QJE98004.1 hypothetical protein HHL09_20165 [Luteolibacter luteus]